MRVGSFPTQATYFSSQLLITKIKQRPSLTNKKGFGVKNERIRFWRLLVMMFWVYVISRPWVLDGTVNKPVLLKYTQSHEAELVNDFCFIFANFGSLKNVYFFYTSALFSSIFPRNLRVHNFNVFLNNKLRSDSFLL